MHNTIVFTKMHSLGNDFIIIDETILGQHLTQAFISALTNRHTGVGCDQLITFKKVSEKVVNCRIFNTDGSEAQQCGNGLRCLANFLLTKKHMLRPKFSLQTSAGKFPTIVKDDGWVELNLGLLTALKIDRVETAFVDTKVILSRLSLGNPHAILIQAEDNYNLISLGTHVQTLSQFPEGVNLGLMKILDQQNIYLRTFERGVGPTYACGSNACAAVIVGIVAGLLDNCVQVHYEKGVLQVGVQENHIMLSGSTTFVFEGIYTPQILQLN
jgi:diaminopimelate epimerase